MAIKINKIKVSVKRSPRLTLARVARNCEGRPKTGGG